MLSSRSEVTDLRVLTTIHILKHTVECFVFFQLNSELAFMSKLHEVVDKVTKTNHVIIKTNLYKNVKVIC